MSFTISSHKIAISPDSILSAQCRRCNGEWQESSIRLNDFLGNEDGSFLLGDRDFSKTAKDIKVEQSNDSSVLHANLRKRDWSWQEATIDLDTFITNKDGELCLYVSLRLAALHLDSLTTCINRETDVFISTIGNNVTQELQTLVNKCESSARDLQASIRSSITEGACTAISSITCAFQGIEDTQYALRDGRVDVTETISHQAVHINSLFSTSILQWTQVENAVAIGSQKAKEFQHTQLHDATREIEQTEQKIVLEITETELRKSRIEDQVDSLQTQIDLHEEAQSSAKEQADAANGRTIGFSIVSKPKQPPLLDPTLTPTGLGDFAIYLHPLGGVIIPSLSFRDHTLTEPHSVASNEREEWGRKRDDFQEKISEARSTQEKQRALLSRLEKADQAAKASKEKCLILRQQTDKLTTDLQFFETGIHELKKNMTFFSQHLRAAETSAVTAFQYSQTLEEGRAILNDALRLRSEFLSDKLDRLLEM